ncbi:HalOD1 output domain-containing protein [Natrinema caseinilyticum]|uniref:HalOD1 output domain-containing protein n=1 Tax=Natrinema caseinilyticum TaxID=2961570 RepID=UPI0020C31047|nr:HalOD1 output domain-containing protein [Natrinema caseinilyticum]
MPGTTPRDNLTPIGSTADRTVYYDGDRGTYHAWCDDDAYEPVSMALVTTVSSVLGVEPEDLEALWECVDPDALNALFIHWRGDESRVGDGSISFPFSQCAVTVRSSGELVIDPSPRSTRRDGDGD